MSSQHQAFSSVPGSATSSNAPSASASKEKASALNAPSAAAPEIRPREDVPRLIISVKKFPSSLVGGGTPVEEFFERVVGTQVLLSGEDGGTSRSAEEHEFCCRGVKR